MLKILLPAFLTFALAFFSSSVSAEYGQKQIPSEPGAVLPFQDGEKLVYEISWSNLVHAGTAVMEVREKTQPDGRAVYDIVSRANSGGMLSRFYKVSDTIESVVDSQRLSSISFHLDQHHGKRTKHQDMSFDSRKGTVEVVADGVTQTYPVPDNIQDALSSLYYVRTKNDFIVGKPIVVNVHEDGKTWSVEVQTLGREKLKTVLGDTNTIKIKTYPRYDGVFQNRGEIYIWLTDDERKIPVLMKSTISIGSIVSTLISVQSGEKKHELTKGIQASLPDH